MDDSSPVAAAWSLSGWYRTDEGCACVCKSGFCFVLCDQLLGVIDWLWRLLADQSIPLPCQLTETSSVDICQACLLCGGLLLFVLLDLSFSLSPAVRANVRSARFAGLDREVQC